MNALKLSNISKRFGDLIANDDISLTIAKGEVLALIGENGAGKSTLMNILFGHYVADQGEIQVMGKALPPGDPQAALAHGLGMVHQHFTLADNLSVLDNVMLGTESLAQLRQSRADAHLRITSLAARFGLEINPSALVRALSVGEKQRVEILKALYRGAKILILDEPTSVLTPQEVTQLFDTLKQLIADGLSIIFISHKLDEVLAISQRIVVLRSGRVVFESQTREATKASLAHAMIGRNLSAPTETRAPRLHEAKRAVLTLTNVFATTAERKVSLRDVSLSIVAGEIVAIAGVSGNGQALLCDVLFGLVRVAQGEIRVEDVPVKLTPQSAIRTGIARIPEDRQHVASVSDLSVWENAILPRIAQAKFSWFGILRTSTARDHAAALVQTYDVRLASIEQPIRTLSGGNIQKLMMARELAEKPRLIVAAQPTWGLDVGAVAFIHQQLREAREHGAAVLLITEDLEEARALADRIAVMSKGRLTAAKPNAEWSVDSLGLAMAGEGIAEEQHAA